ncbi:MAG: protoporphyrinogen oxidase HemJ [Nisaea sp.]|jgi:putative membrane protein|uniref:protoporphyrinogen oxidase HemJ n=1 Tax=Nisaea sp. TaxID=2024842 RepID=UPI001B172908|nr:protoporphyrinogen oxidase HemJ [Nisaea sp.]MBO6561700.1 protoporphyrinogen oxidase HemJ [Nisaea sp.]
MSYEWVKAFHVMSMVAWMAGMFYLPRLFVYHADAAPGSELSETLKIMERRLLRAIINPAMVSTFVFGIWMLVLIPEFLSDGWFHVKLACLFLLTGFHGMMARWRRDFAADANRRSARFYRIANEVPTVLLIVIVIMVIVKPFS